MQLITESPQHLLVKYVFDNSLTWRKIHPNDILVGVNYQLFTIAHKNGYGMDKFEPDGPILKFATALGSCQVELGKGLVPITLVRQQLFNYLVQYQGEDGS